MAEGGEGGATKRSLQTLEATVTVSQSTAKLFLTDKLLYYESQSEKKCEVLLEDLIGVQVVEDKKTKIACNLTVHYFPIVSKREKRNHRKLSQMSVVFDKGEDQKENLKVATQWKNNILLQADRIVKLTFEYGDIISPTRSCNIGEDGEDLPERRNILVMLNPYAGDQKGEAKFKKIVQPMFDLSEIKYSVILTKYQNHAHQLVQELDLTKYSGIVIASGDGLLYEIVNGIMKRPDWKMSIKIPVGMLPVGSGNALAASTLYEAGEEYSLEAAAFLIIRGGFTPLNLATVQTCDGNQCYMTLLANWGIVADIDIGSESMRKLGETRFTIGTIQAIAKKKVYRGKLSYLPCDEDQKSSISRIIPASIMQAVREGHGNFISPESSLSSVNWREEPGTPIDPNPESSLNSINGSGSFVKNGMDDFEGSCNGTSNGNAAENPHTTKTEVSAACAQEIPDGTKSSVSHEHQGPATDLLVPLNDSLPDSWKTCSEELFLSITPLMVPFMSRNSFGDSRFQIGSKEFRLMCVKGSAGRRNTFKFFVNTKTGEHVEMEDVFVISAKAFRIEPTNGGTMTIDGEKVKTGPLQAQIHPHMAFVMGRKKNSTC